MKWEGALGGSKDMMYVNMTYKMLSQILIISRIMTSSALSLKADVCAHFMAKLNKL